MALYHAAHPQIALMLSNYVTALYTPNLQTYWYHAMHIYSQRFQITWTSN